MIDEKRPVFDWLFGVVRLHTALQVVSKGMEPRLGSDRVRAEMKPSTHIDKVESSQTLSSVRFQSGR